MNWAAFLIYAITTAATPGPNNILSMSNGSRRGFLRALPFNLGIWLGFSAVSVLCAFFLEALARFLPFIKLPMIMLGSAYMLYLARTAFHAEGDIKGREGGSGFLHGLLLQFVNPKEYIYCIVSLEAYILPVYHGQAPQLLLFALLLAFIGFFFTLLWSAFGSAFRLLFTRHARVINTVMGLLLIYCALALFLA